MLTLPEFNTANFSTQLTKRHKFLSQSAQETRKNIYAYLDTVYFTCLGLCQLNTNDYKHMIAKAVADNNWQEVRLQLQDLQHDQKILAMEKWYQTQSKALQNPVLPQQVAQSHLPKHEQQALLSQLSDLDVCGQYLHYPIQALLRAHSTLADLHRHFLHGGIQSHQYNYWLWWLWPFGRQERKAFHVAYLKYHQTQLQLIESQQLNIQQTLLLRLRTMLASQGSSDDPITTMEHQLRRSGITTHNTSRYRPSNSRDNFSPSSFHQTIDLLKNARSKKIREQVAQITWCESFPDDIGLEERMHGGISVIYPKQSTAHTSLFHAITKKILHWYRTSSPLFNNPYFFWKIHCAIHQSPNYEAILKAQETIQDIRYYQLIQEAETTLSIYSQWLAKQRNVHWRFSLFRLLSKPIYVELDQKIQDWKVQLLKTKIEFLLTLVSSAQVLKERGDTLYKEQLSDIWQQVQSVEAALKKQGEQSIPAFNHCYQLLSDLKQRCDTLPPSPADYLIEQLRCFISRESSDLRILEDLPKTIAFLNAYTHVADTPQLIEINTLYQTAIITAEHHLRDGLKPWILQRITAQSLVNDITYLGFCANLINVHGDDVAQQKIQTRAEKLLLSFLQQTESNHNSHVQLCFLCELFKILELNELQDACVTLHMLLKEQNKTEFTAKVAQLSEQIDKKLTIKRFNKHVSIFTSSSQKKLGNMSNLEIDIKSQQYQNIKQKIMEECPSSLTNAQSLDGSERRMLGIDKTWYKSSQKLLHASLSSEIFLNKQTRAIKAANSSKIRLDILSKTQNHLKQSTLKSLLQQTNKRPLFSQRRI